jgi:hypothetical protein
VGGANSQTLNLHPRKRGKARKKIGRGLRRANNGGLHVMISRK